MPKIEVNAMEKLPYEVAFFRMIIKFDKLDHTAVTQWKQQQACLFAHLHFRQLNWIWIPCFRMTSLLDNYACNLAVTNWRGQMSFRCQVNTCRGKPVATQVP